MNIEEIANRIAELHYPNKPNAIIDEPYRLIRMRTLIMQIKSELKNVVLPDVSNAKRTFCEHKWTTLGVGEILMYCKKCGKPR